MIEGLRGGLGLSLGFWAPAAERVSFEVQSPGWGFNQDFGIRSFGRFRVIFIGFRVQGSRQAFPGKRFRGDQNGFEKRGCPQP